MAKKIKTKLDQPVEDMPKNLSEAILETKRDIFGENLPSEPQHISWLQQLGINPKFNQTEARSAIDQILWFKDSESGRKNLALAVTQSIKDDEASGQDPFSLPNDKMFRLTVNGELTDHFIRWFDQKCIPGSDGVRAYSFEAFKRGDYPDVNIAPSSQTYSYKGKATGVLRKETKVISRFVHERLCDNPGITNAVLWAELMGALPDLAGDCMLTAQPEQNPEYIRVDEDDSIPIEERKTIRLKRLCNIAAEERKKLNI